MWILIGFIVLSGLLNCDPGETSSLTKYCRDADLDGYGDPDDSVMAEVPSGLYTATVCTDCDDAQATVYPGATEICNDGLDNDCDGFTDCQDSDCTGDIGPGGGACLPESEACSDGYDNDGDGYVDCADAECLGTLECILAGVDYEVLLCGDSVTDTNDFDLGISVYGCNDRLSFPGKESIFLFIPPSAGVVTIELTINTTENLDLFLLEDDLSPDSCISYSNQPGTTAESITLSAEEDRYYFIIVDALQASDTGNFTIELSCN